VGLFQLMLAVRGLVDRGRNVVRVLVPCLPYARSDRRAGPTAAIGREVIVDALRSAGASEVITIELHSSHPDVSSDGLTDVSAVPRLMGAACSLVGGGDGLVVLPDGGARDRMGRAPEAAGLRSLEFTKVRLGDDRVSTVTSGHVRGDRIAVIVDDALYTGATHAAVADGLHQMGVEQVHLVVAHALPGPSAMSRLAASGVASLTHLDTSGWRGPDSMIDVVELTWADAVLDHWSTRHRSREQSKFQPAPVGAATRARLRP